MSVFCTSCNEACILHGWYEYSYHLNANPQPASQQQQLFTPSLPLSSYYDTSLGTRTTSKLHPLPIAMLNFHQPLSA